MTKKKGTESDLQKYDNRPDETNPKFMFSLTANQLLAEALRGEFVTEYLIKRELANRGLDQDGKWVGFDKAKKLHGIQ